MNYNFVGKTVFITGSSRGIGKAIAMAFARAGANVAINASVSKGELAEALADIKAITDKVIALVGDISDYEQCSAMIDNIKRSFGGIDILVNNAGVSYVGLFSDMSPKEMKRVMDININGVMNCSHIVVLDMVRKKSGNIINISSMWGNVGASCEVVYSASKGAVNMFTRALGKELAPSGIRVNAIACGAVDTKMNSFLSEEEKVALIDEIPMMRFASAEEIARTALFLASDDSSYITAQIITMDGAMN